jgi:hypothetical protein
LVRLASLARRDRSDGWMWVDGGSLHDCNLARLQKTIFIFQTCLFQFGRFFRIFVIAFSQIHPPFQPYSSSIPKCKASKSQSLLTLTKYLEKYIYIYNIEWTY